MQKDKAFFDRLYKRFNKRGLVTPDPLQFLYAYPDVKDREIAALLGACFAYGNVKQIIKNVDNLLAAMPSGPHAFITQHNTGDFRKTFSGFKYRFTTAQELCALLVNIKHILEQYGTLEGCFLHYYKKEEESVLPALRAFAGQLRRGGKISSLVPDPAKNSALKRLNLFLRWMVRQDEVDPGGWGQVSPAKLIVPLDVHMHRLGLMLGLTARKQADMKTALEITRSLARFCPNDPVKYDFCLTRFGIRDDMSYNDLPSARRAKPRRKTPAKR